MLISRRKFIKNTGMVAATAPIISAFPRPSDIYISDQPLNISIFSKHLQFLDFKEAGQIAAELGFNGLDLTVRPKGHISPENVKSALPIAIRDIKTSGSSCEMITTAIADASNSVDKSIIEVASAQGIKYYRSDWFKYNEDQSLEASLNYYQEKVRQLSKLNQDHDIIGCYQNHSGLKVGASIWEIKKILETAEPKFFGAQYDIRHAVAEGGRSWPNGVKLIKNHIKTIVLKDFKWGEVGGNWQIINVPIGEGMVDFKRYFQMLKGYGLNPPVSLHLEYPLGGAEKGKLELKVDKKVVYDAMRRDLNAIKKMWKEA